MSDYERVTKTLNANGYEWIGCIGRINGVDFDGYAHDSGKGSFILGRCVQSDKTGLYHFVGSDGDSVDSDIEYIESLHKPFPKVVVLCGSTRFYEVFQQANYEETMKGNIVLSVGFYPHANVNKNLHGEDVGCTPEQKIKLDELHKRKIDLADEVFVLNVGGYIGESTRSEIEYAEAHNKPVRYLEPVTEGELV